MNNASKFMQKFLNFKKNIYTSTSKISLEYQIICLNVKKLSL